MRGHPYGVGLLARAGRRRARLLGLCGLGFSGFGGFGLLGLRGPRLSRGRAGGAPEGAGTRDLFVWVRAGLWVSLLGFGFVVFCMSCHSVVLGLPGVSFCSGRGSRSAWAPGSLLVVGTGAGMLYGAASGALVCLNSLHV